MQSQWMAESELRRKISFFSDLYPTTADDEQHDEGLAASIKAFTTYSKNDGPITIPMTPTHIGLEGPKSLEFNVTSGVAVAMGLRGTSTRTAVDFIRNDVDSLVSSRPSTPQSCLVIKETPVVGHNKRQTGGLRQEAASSSVMPSSSRATLKRKKSDIVNQVAPNQRIFNDLCFCASTSTQVSLELTHASLYSKQRCFWTTQTANKESDGVWGDLDPRVELGCNSCGSRLWACPCGCSKGVENLADSSKGLNSIFSHLMTDIARITWFS